VCVLLLPAFATALLAPTSAFRPRQGCRATARCEHGRRFSKISLLRAQIRLRRRLLDSPESKRFNTRLRRSARVMQKNMARISAGVEAEVESTRLRAPWSLPLNEVRQQIASGLNEDGTLASSPATVSGGAEARAAERVTVASDLRRPGRRVAVVTTAALPWMTGTSINPLMRAAYLATRGIPTTLVLPWLQPEQQPLLFPPGVTFATEEEQGDYVRAWLGRSGSTPPDGLSLRWYEAVYEPFLGAIIQRPRVDITQVVPPSERDVAILDEPEHLNWYHHGAQWTEAYTHVVGVAHTNYVYYAIHEEREGGAGDIAPETRGAIIASLNGLVCRAHLDVSLRLSAALDDVPGLAGRSVVCNVHGVRSEFLAIGAEVATLSASERESGFGGGAYFLAKALWTKGYRTLLDQLQSDLASGALGALPSGDPRPNGGGQLGASELGASELGASELAEGVPLVSLFGSGRDEAEIDAAAARLAPHVRKSGAINHADPSLRPFSCFVNPSCSEVLCTATAEALAMGKKVLIPRHPSNDFFEQFTNTEVYDDPSELFPRLRNALASPPAPLSAKELYLLSWEGATERLIDAAALAPSAPPLRADALHGVAYALHNTLTLPPFDDYFRANSGATPLYASWSERLANLGSAAPSTPRS